MPTTSVLLADETGFHPALENVFDMKYPTTLVDRTSPSLTKYHPLNIHDRHLDPFLSMKYVKPMGFSISEYLSKFCDSEIMDFVRNKQPLKTGRDFRPSPPAQETLSTAYDVGLYYVDHVGRIASGFPSRLYLRPSAEDWRSFTFVSPLTDRGERDEIFKQSTGLYFCNEREIRKYRPRPSDEDISEMKRLEDKYPQLTIFDFFEFSQTARKLLEDMGRQEGFEWETPGTDGYAMDVAPPELPPDSTAGLWSKISSTNSQPKKKLRGKQELPSTPSSKTRTQGNLTKGEKAQSRTVRVAVRKGTRGRPYRPAAKDFLQKAWLHAVEIDATFLLFHCGKAERIGFRHRETQTLYLSEIIDPSVVEKYAKIHVGLHLAVVKDVLERDVLSSTKKRPAEPIPVQRPSKRRKQAEVVDSSPSAELLAKSLGTRNLALLAFDHKFYRSPVPSSFVRVKSTWGPAQGINVDEVLKRKARYPALEYFTLVLGDRIGGGAVGMVYRASVTFRSGTKTFDHAELAVKLSYLEPQQTSLKHEYAIYKLLASRGAAQNILPVYGMFQDAESGVLALVMDYGGDSLWSRLTEDGRVSFTHHERTAITDAFRQLHAAGILHGDIRLNNLLLDSSGAVSIIDFDQAQVDPEEKQLKKEMDELAHVLRNRDEDNDDY